MRLLNPTNEFYVVSKETALTRELIDKGFRLPSMGNREENQRFPNVWREDLVQFGKETKPAFPAPVCAAADIFSCTLMRLELRKLLISGLQDLPCSSPGHSLPRGGFRDIARIKDSHRDVLRARQAKVCAHAFTFHDPASTVGVLQASHGSEVCSVFTPVSSESGGAWQNKECHQTS